MTVTVEFSAKQKDLWNKKEAMEYENFVKLQFYRTCCGWIICSVTSLRPQRWSLNLWIFHHISSLVLERSGCDFKKSVLNHVLLIGTSTFRCSHVNAIRYMNAIGLTDKSTLVQVMAWCRQATSHYLSQCGPRPISLFGVNYTTTVLEKIYE